MLREIVEGINEMKVVFPLSIKKGAELKKTQQIASKFNVKFDSTWDSGNTSDFRMVGSKEDISAFLKEIGYESLVNQI